jgi:dTDP-4-dehydrorhamnose reductase
MSTVAVLGSTGMLGSTVARVLAENGHEVLEFNRSGVASFDYNQAYVFSISKISELEYLLTSKHVNYVVNCVGLIKQRINENSKLDSLNAIEVNSLFPGLLQEVTNKQGMKLIQIGTDCVFSGSRGSYSELDGFDPPDLYGRTKLNGELNSEQSMIIRTSIIGLERNGSFSLLSWLLSQPKNTVINGFTNHYWNGLTTFHFARVVSGMIEVNHFLPGINHLVPQNVVSKYTVLKVAAQAFGRNDLNIVEFEAPQLVNRSLSTADSSQNSHLWSLGGYNVIPRVEDMIFEYSNWFKSNQN